MTEDQRKDEASRAGAAEGGVGDVESAGETTAAATTGGSSTADTRPVGADTLVRVEGDPPPAEGGEE